MSKKICLFARATATLKSLPKLSKFSQASKQSSEDLKYRPLPTFSLPLTWLYEPLSVLYEAFGYRLAMPQLQHILIAVLALYCCFMVFKVSANAGFFLLPLLFVLPPLVFKGRKKESGEGE